MASIELDHIIKIYDVKKNKKSDKIPEGIRAINDISFVIPSGSFTVLVGPSGCGKTTLLRMIAGLEEITSGTIKIDGVDITNFEPGDRGLAMVFQSYALYPHMSVRDNIEFGLVNARIPKSEIKQRTDEALEIVELLELQNRRPAYLSGGQRQRVALARAISKKPQCFLMDEPLSNLDAKLRSEMRTDLILLHNELASTFVYVTHDQIEAMTMGNNIVVMNEGMIIQQGTPSEIHNDPNCVFVAQFVGDPGMNIIPIGNYQIGFRPRDVHIDPEKGDESSCIISGTIDGVENHGSEFLYSLQFLGSRLFIKEFSKTSRKIYSQVAFAVDEDDFYLFDKEGKRIYNAVLIGEEYGIFKKSCR